MKGEAGEVVFYSSQRSKVLLRWFYLCTLDRVDAHVNISWILKSVQLQSDMVLQLARVTWFVNIAPAPAVEGR